MSTKDEIRAALEARPECEHEKKFWREFEFNGRCHDCDADVIAALLPEETKTIEWGVKYACTRDSDEIQNYGADEDRARYMAEYNFDGSLWHRTVTTYAPTRTPWEEA